MFTREEIEIAYKIGKNSITTAKMLGISPTQFKRLMHRYNLTFLPRTEQEGRCKQWSPIPSPELSYVLGVILGDGHVTGRTRHRNCFKILLSVTDWVFAEKFASYLKAIGIHSWMRLATKDKRPNRNQKYTATASSKRFAQWYKKLTLLEIADVIVGFEEFFVCGLWESEGHVVPENDHFDLTLGMTREDIIDLLIKIVKSWNMHPTKQGPYKDNRPNRKDIYRICLSRKEETKEFIKRINPCIKSMPRQSRAKQVLIAPGVCRD